MASRSSDYRIDPFDLQLFEAVVEHGSITAGAQAMSLSLAAASERLKTLEHRVGVQLFERSKTGTVATDAGRALSRQANRVLTEIDSLHVTMAAFGQGLRGTVRLLCITAAIAEALPPQLGRFLAKHPDIDVELQEMSSIDALHGLRSGAAEVAIVANHVDTSGLTTRHWLDHELVVLMPAGRKVPKSIRYAELLDRPFVGLDADAGLSRFLQQHATRSGRVPHHRIRVRSFDAIARLVETGAGVAVMPLTSAQRWMTPGLRIARLEEPWAQRRMLLCHTTQALELTGVRALIEALTPG